MEDDADTLVLPSKAASGLGVFFMGVAALSFMSVHRLKNDPSGPPEK